MPGTPLLGSTTAARTFSDLTQINAGGHTLVVTITPVESEFLEQTVERRYRTGMAIEVGTVRRTLGPPCSLVSFGLRFCH